jgi:hypothetical protein
MGSQTCIGIVRHITREWRQECRDRARQTRDQRRPLDVRCAPGPTRRDLLAAVTQRAVVGMKDEPFASPLGRRGGDKLDFVNHVDLALDSRFDRMISTSGSAGSSAATWSSTSTTGSASGRPASSTVTSPSRSASQSRGSIRAGS